MKNNRTNNRNVPKRNFVNKENFSNKDKSFGLKNNSNQNSEEKKIKINLQKNRFVLKKETNLEKNIFDSIRLNRFISNAGICSRREADDLIKNGLVQVNGKIITEMGYKVSKEDVVKFDDKTLKPEKPVYLLLNKPKGFISTSKDEKMRKTVLDLVSKATPYRVFPVGRLDRPTTGVLILTNDGELTKKLTHPSHDVRKIYHVVLNQKLSQEHFNLIKNEGVKLYEGVANVDSISYIEGKPKTEIGIEVHIGWNRVVRRIFEKLDYEVVALDRVSFAGLTKKNVKRGDWRHLTAIEINRLKMI